MIWIFAAVVLWLAVAVPGFRKFLGYSALAIGALVALLVVISAAHGP
jgi:hypothetical protein